MNYTFEKKLIILFSIVILAVVTAGVFAFKNNQSSSKTLKWVEHNRDVLYGTRNILSNATELETNTRGYAVTGDSSFIKPFEIANNAIHNQLTKLSDLTKNNSYQQIKTDSLKKCIDERIKFSIQTITLRNEKGFSESKRLIISFNKKDYLQQISRFLESIQEEENDLLEKQERVNFKTNSAFNFSFLILLGSVLFLLVIISFSIKSNYYARNKIEEELKLSLREISDYKLALDESSIVAITDQKGIIKYANDNFCKISKYRRNELIGQDHRMINSDHHSKEFIRDMWVTLANGNLWKGEFKNKAKDGTFYWVNTVIVPFLNSEGKPFQYMAIRSDITIQKAQQEMLKTQADELKLQHEETLRINTILEDHTREVNASIRYAKNIQNAILPKEETFKSIFNEAFLLYKPKDIVGGDFYWLSVTRGKVIIACGDCTGHGVPGALMTMVGQNLLKQAVEVKQLLSPASILAYLNTGLKNTFHQNNTAGRILDGMEIGICSFDFKTNVHEFSGARMPLIITRNGISTIIKPDSFGISHDTPGNTVFTNNNFELKKGDCLYLFSDGYADQFGWANDKRFMKKQLLTTFAGFMYENMDAQKDNLLETFNTWKGELQQVDDVLVIGIKF